MVEVLSSGLASVNSNFAPVEALPLHSIQVPRQRTVGDQQHLAPEGRHLPTSRETAAGAGPGGGLH